MNVVLGSSSPRRRKLLSLLREDFSVLVPEVDETPLENEKPKDYCSRISKLKSVSLSEMVPVSTLLVCADTIVTIDGIILGKPSSREEGFAMLKMLSGKTHSVITTLTLLLKENVSAKNLQLSACTSVQFKELTDTVIESYLSQTAYSDKAGSYAAQENGSLLIKTLDGPLSNVIGFPVSLFLRMISEMGLFNRFFNI